MIWRHSQKKAFLYEKTAQYSVTQKQKERKTWDRMEISVQYHCKYTLLYHSRGQGQGYREHDTHNETARPTSANVGLPVLLYGCECRSLLRKELPEYAKLILKRSDMRQTQLVSGNVKMV